MEHGRIVAAVVLSTLFPSFLFLLLFLFYCHLRKRLPRCSRSSKSQASRRRSGIQSTLTVFAGFTELTVKTILEAQGEVIATSRYSILYRAILRTPTNADVALLRFIQPRCLADAEAVVTACHELSKLCHPNVVPLQAVYIGPRGEALLVHPFYSAGNLHRFLLEGMDERQRWEIVRRLVLGIARGLHHLHGMLPAPVVHGNLKASNVMLDIGGEPRIADAGIYSLLTPEAAQAMLEASASQGYKAPEVASMGDATRESDVYSFGVVLLELLGGKADDVALTPASGPTKFRDLVLERKISKAFGAEVKQGSGQRWGGLLTLATACCSPSPLMRPKMKQVLAMVEEACTPAPRAGQQSQCGR